MGVSDEQGTSCQNGIKDAADSSESPGERGSHRYLIAV